MNIENEDYSREIETYNKIMKQGLEYQYRSENLIATKCIEWINEWTREELKKCDDFFNGHISGLKSMEECKAAINYYRTHELTEQSKEQIRKTILYKRCMLLEMYIEKIESTLNESCDFEFFNLYEDLYKGMIVNFANENWEQNYKYTCMLADYRKEFNENRQ